MACPLESDQRPGAKPSPLGPAQRFQNTCRQHQKEIMQSHLPANRKPGSLHPLGTQSAPAAAAPTEGTQTRSNHLFLLSTLPWLPVRGTHLRHMSTCCQASLQRRLSTMLPAARGPNQLQDTSQRSAADNQDTEFWPAQPKGGIQGARRDIPPLDEQVGTGAPEQGRDPSNGSLWPHCHDSSAALTLGPATGTWAGKLPRALRRVCHATQLSTSAGPACPSQP